MKSRKTSQKISLVIAYLCYLAAGLTFLAAIVRGITVGTENPIFASMAASVVFFIGCGVVLHVIGVVNLPNLKIEQKNQK